VHVVDLLSVNTMCNFERGGAKKLIIAEITAKWTALTCVRYRNVPIWFCWLFFIEYNVFKYPSYPDWSVLNAHTTTFKEVKSLCELHGLQLWRAICERIWEKGPLCAETEFLFLIAHNFKAVIVTDFKPGIMNSANVLNPRWN